MIEGLPTFREAFDAELASMGKEERSDEGVVLHLTADLPADGTPDRWLGMGARGTAMEIGGLDATALGARGRTIGRTSRGTTVVAYSDLVVAMVPAGDGEDGEPGAFQLSAVKLARPGDELLDLAGLARLVGDEWLGDDDPRIRRFDAEAHPEIGPLLALARAVQLAETGRDVGHLGMAFPNPAASKGAEVLLGSRRNAPPEGDLVWEVLGGIASRLPEVEAWDADPLGCRRLAGCWTPGRHVVALPFEPPRLSFLRGRVGRDAGAKVVAAMEAGGWPGETVSRARARWTATPSAAE